jgi:hypothetical protein
MPHEERTMRGRIRRAVTVIAAKLHLGRRSQDEEAPHRTSAPSPRRRQEGSSRKSRPETPRPIQTDVPIDLIAKEYIPHQTASKGGFRVDTADRFAEQDIVREDDRFRPEDLLTNHSGDPRIGTHGRPRVAQDHNREEAR